MMKCPAFYDVGAGVPGAPRLAIGVYIKKSWSDKEDTVVYGSIDNCIWDIVFFTIER